MDSHTQRYLVSEAYRPPEASPKATSVCSPQRGEMMSDVAASLQPKSRVSSEGRAGFSVARRPGG